MTCGGRPGRPRCGRKPAQPTKVAAPSGISGAVSPIARAMIGKEAGEVAEFQAPGGTRRYEIVEVRYL